MRSLDLPKQESSVMIEADVLFLRKSCDLHLALAARLRCSPRRVRL